MHMKEKDPLACSCGATFRTTAKIARHLQKWNAKADLRDRKLVRA